MTWQFTKRDILWIACMCHVCEMFLSSSTKINVVNRLSEWVHILQRTYKFAPCLLVNLADCCGTSLVIVVIKSVLVWSAEVHKRGRRRNRRERKGLYFMSGGNYDRKKSLINPRRDRKSGPLAKNDSGRHHNKRTANFSAGIQNSF